MNPKFHFAIYLISVIAGCLAFPVQAQIKLADLWTEKALVEVVVQVNDETLLTDAAGYLRINEELSRSKILNLRIDGYFPVEIESSKSRPPIIYFEPLFSTTEITVVRGQAADTRLAIPSSNTRIDMSEINLVAGASLEKTISAEKGIFVKSYGGTNSLQTIALRGMTAEQTQVLFDGVPLNSLQLGSYNLSQFNQQNLQSVDIYRGGNTIFGGTGAIGGTINLRPLLHRKDFGYQIMTEIGSFENHDLSARVDIPLGNYQQFVSINQSGGKNNFRAIENDSNTQLQNRDFGRHSAAYSGKFNFNSQWAVDGYFSTMQDQSGSPRAYINPQSEITNLARTENEQSLSKLKLTYQNGLGSAYTQFYTKNEWMSFNDPQILEDGEMLSSLHFNHEKGFQLRGRFLIYENLLLNGGIEASSQVIKSSEIGEKDRERIAGYVHMDWQLFSGLQRLHLNGSIRVENYSDFGSVLLPSIGSTIQWDDLELYISAGKNYRAPGFNDLYWQPGGNPDLKPEESVNTEVGFEYQRSFELIAFSITGGVYLNRVDNQIKWQPQIDYWRPSNIARVLSRGIELEAQLSSVNKKHLLKINYHYGQATKDKSEFAGDKTKGNQIPYIPAEQWHALLKSGYKFWSCGLKASANSFRYLTLQNDPEQILPSYITLDIWNTVDIDFLGQHATVSFTIENILDEYYQVMPGYPMPPRNFKIGITIKN